MMSWIVRGEIPREPTPVTGCIQYIPEMSVPEKMVRDELGTASRSFKRFLSNARTMSIW